MTNLDFGLLFALVFQLPGASSPSTLIAFAMKTLTGGQLTSKLHVIEVGAQNGPQFSKKQADLFFPPGFEDDFPVSMQVWVERLAEG